MRWIVAVVLVVLALAVFPSNRVLSQGDDYLPLPVSAAPKIAMSLPTTGDPRADLMAIMTLSATLLSLAESVRGRLTGAKNGATEDEPRYANGLMETLGEVVEPPPATEEAPVAVTAISDVSDLGC